MLRLQSYPLTRCCLALTLYVCAQASQGLGFQPGNNKVRVDVSYCGINHQGLACLSSLQNLQHLDLRNNALLSFDLVGLSKLSYLDLRGNNLSMVSIAGMSFLLVE